MFLTPADPQSMLLMAVPLTVLYFGGVLLCRLFPRRRSPYDEEPEDRPPEDRPPEDRPPEDRPPEDQGPNAPKD